MADGSIKIDIVGEDKELQKKLKEIEKLEKQKKKIELTLEVNDASMGEAEAKLNKQIDKYWQLMDKKAEIEKKKITMPAMNLGTGTMPEESFYLDKDQADLDRINEKIARQEELMDGVEAKQKRLTSARKEDESVLQGINDKLQTAKSQADGIKLNNMKQDISENNTGLGGIGDKLKGIITKVTKWGLAVLGVRGAYSAVRRLMSTLSQYNEQLKTDLSYIGFSIAKVFEPVILRIVELVYQALQFINSLITSMFGVNLFAKSTAEAFNKGNSSMGGMVSGAKELKKLLAGFDEMNRLEQGAEDVSGSGGGAFTPSVDLSKTSESFEKIKMWWKNTIDIMNIDFQDGLKKMELGTIEMTEGLENSMSGFMKILKGLWTDNVDLVVEGFEDIDKGYSDILEGMVLNQEGFNDIIEKMLQTLWEAIKVFAKMKWEEIKKDFMNWLKGTGKDTKKESRSFMEMLTIYLKALLYPMMGSLGIIVQNWLLGLFVKLIFIIAEEMLKIKKEIEQKWEEIKVGLKKEWDETVKSFKQIFGGIINFIVGAFSGDWSRAWNGIKSIFTGIWDSMIRGVKNAINGIISLINLYITSMNRLNITSWLPGAKPIGIMPEIPYLATGGIINYPNHGVVLGRAIAGESGAEGVIPLTDSQAMARLGKAIGENIVLNATLNTVLNARTINRETKRIELGDNFATNGGYR